MKHRNSYLIVFSIVIFIALLCMHLLIMQQGNFSDEDLIFWEFKIPRMLSAILAGAGLSLSGLLMQNLFQNPMAGPYVLGINSGASMFMALLLLGITPTFNGLSYVGGAMIGAFLSAILMFVISKRVQNMQSLLVIGLMLASFMGAFESVLQTFAAPEQIKQLYIWNMGSLQQMSADQAPWFALIVLVGIALSLWVVKGLNALIVGEFHANQLGISVSKVRMLILFVTALLAGSTTAFCGPIAFVGLAIPNLARALLKTQDHLVLILFTVFIGSSFLLAIDVLILVLEPWMGLPLNVLTAVFGAPYVAYLMLKKK